MKILIIGGYGAFGGRLARLLADNPMLQIYIGGRTLLKAESLCAELNGNGAVFTPVKVDKFNLAPTLARYTPDIVVDASGPFNLKSDKPYAAVEACLAVGCHYLDLADGADFVMNISQFDQVAREKDLTIVSGLSTCPALTGAVLKDAQKDMTVKSFEIGVAPSPFAKMGLSVVKGIFDYAGSKITTRENGQNVSRLALGNARRKTICPPGAMPLRNRLFSFVDCPDLQVFPLHNSGMQNGWVGAGTKPGWLLRILMLLAKIRAAFGLPAFSFLAKPGHWFLNSFARGEHRGGLYMNLKNDDETREWHVLAEGDDGPFIPSMACAALIHKWCEHPPEIGARDASQELSLEDFDPFFEARDIRFGWRQETENVHGFEQILSHEFNNLPEPVRVLHAPEGVTKWTGKTKAEGPSNILGRLAGLVAGVNVRTGETDTVVTITPTPKGEVWERNFGGRKFKSRLTPGTGKNAHLMMEHFGPLKFALALITKEDRLYFIPRRWFFLGVPMPQFLLPKGDTFETVKDGKFQFNVDLKVPFIGRIAKYQGWLEKET